MIQEIVHSEEEQHCNLHSVKVKRRYYDFKNNFASIHFRGQAQL